MKLGSGAGFAGVRAGRAATALAGGRATTGAGAALLALATTIGAAPIAGTEALVEGVGAVAVTGAGNVKGDAEAEGDGEGDVVGEGEGEGAGDGVATTTGAGTGAGIPAGLEVGRVATTGGATAAPPLVFGAVVVAPGSGAAPCKPFRSLRLRLSSATRAAEAWL